MQDETPQPAAPTALRRRREPASVEPVLVRRPTLGKITDTSEAWLRLREKQGDGPPLIRVGRVVLYDLEAALAWFRRHTYDPAVIGPTPSRPRRPRAA